MKRIATWFIGLFRRKAHFRFGEKSLGKIWGQKFDGEATLAQPWRYSLPKSTGKANNAR